MVHALVKLPPDKLAEAFNEVWTRRRCKNPMDKLADLVVPPAGIPMSTRQRMAVDLLEAVNKGSWVYDNSCGKSMAPGPGARLNFDNSTSS